MESATASDRAASGSPDLSVVVVTLVDVDHLRHCLAALEKQEGPATFETIVPCDDTVGDTASLRAEFPAAQFIDLTGRRTYAELRATGANAARGRLLAVTEDHCRPAPGWVQSIVTAHGQPPLAIGGVVEKTGPDRSLNWAVYFLDYLRYMPPVEGGETHELTDLNVSYKMSALQDIHAVWTKEFHEPSVHAALEARGGKLWLSPDIVVQQRRELRIGHALWDRYAFGRLFGSTRAASVPGSKRMIYAALAPALPVLLVVRLTRHIMHKKRHIGPFLAALPWIVVLASAWAWGEFIGYLTGTSVAALQPQSERGK